MSIGENLLRYKKDQLFLCADCETTGLNLIHTLPWQIGYITFTLDKNISETNRYIWWPNLKVSIDAARTTRFNLEDYKNKAEDPKKILEEFEDILYSESYKCVSQNWLGYDSMIINSWRRALNLKPRYDYLYQPFKVYDTLCISRAIKKQLKPDTSCSNAFLAWQYKMQSIHQKGLKCSLGVIGKELGVPFDEKSLHNALSDVTLNVEIFRKQVWMMELI
jgi:DNA polymerase III epsilon subunit-like protein